MAPVRGPATAPPAPEKIKAHKYEKTPGSPACLHCGRGRDNEAHGIGGPMDYLNPDFYRPKK